MEIKDIKHKFPPHLKDRFDIEFTACPGELMPKEALTSFTVSLTHIAIVCRSGIVIEVRK